MPEVIAFKPLVGLQAVMTQHMTGRHYYDAEQGTSSADRWEQSHTGGKV